MLFADVAELADALDLGSSVTDGGGSSPFICTITSVLQNLNGFKNTLFIYPAHAA